jgi:hypothetical protein
MDETYLKVRGKWAYLYRAIDRDGNLIDATLSEHRNLAAAKAFFRSAKATIGYRPDRVTTDGHGSYPYPRAIRTMLGRTVRHRTSAYLNNRLEQDHRGIKGRIRCMRGFKSDQSAAHFCREHGGLRDLLRCRRRLNQSVPATTRRSRFAKAARIALGLLISGALPAWVPQSFWTALFLSNDPVWSKIVGPLIGPIVAVLSFVCSVGNVPLAAVLWNGGISFGGVGAFLFADLVVLPILNIYRKYYGMRMTAPLLGLFYVAMVAAGYIVEILFGFAGLLPRSSAARGF